MSDDPRFEPVKGSPDARCRRYRRGRFTGLALRLVGRSRAKPGATQAARPLNPTSGEPSEERPTEEGFMRPRLDKRHSRDFLIDSARTKQLQVGLIMAFIAFLIALLAALLGVYLSNNPSERLAPPGFDHFRLNLELPAFSADGPTPRRAMILGPPRPTPSPTERG